ncbi:MAG: DUF4080 domain-containing protein [Campylobacterota bacterium]|nr:DUF4080 domain-containing protein [Campylobacterota bacterium]
MQLQQSNILLSTFNSRYSHSSIALRYLYANLHELQNQAKILEFVINENAQSIAEKILTCKPRIIGIATYIWNAKDVSELLHVIKKISPDTIIVLGGPEVSHMPHRVNFDAADYIVQGEGEIVFYELCRDILSGKIPPKRTISSGMLDVLKIKLPYEYYNEEDVANRHIYVEASRGCPFLCEFCLSSIDEKMRNFDLDILLEEFEALWQRGVRDFKFIDRTFNINMRFANAILDFFLSKEAPYFAHFEVIPDHFPESLKEKLKQFPAGSLQLEIGIQTLNPTVANSINRPLKLEKIKENIRFLESETKAHMHLDLIVGLPGETLEGLGKNLDELCALSHSEIQIGILKKLSGTSLTRHDREHGMIYSDIPPYDLLQNNLVNFIQMQEMKRFARFWDLLYNSGNFKLTLALLWSDGKVFDNFFSLSLWIFEQTASTWKISLDRLAQLLYDYLLHVKHYEASIIAKAMIEDLLKIKGRKIPVYLKPYVHNLEQELSVNSKHKRQAKS